MQKSYQNRIKIVTTWPTLKTEKNVGHYSRKSNWEYEELFNVLRSLLVCWSMFDFFQNFESGMGQGPPISGTNRSLVNCGESKMSVIQKFWQRNSDFNLFVYQKAIKIYSIGVLNFSRSLKLGFFRKVPANSYRENSVLLKWRVSCGWKPGVVG